MSAKRYRFSLTGAITTQEETFQKVAYSIEIGSAEEVSKLTNFSVKPNGIYRCYCKDLWGPDTDEIL